MPFITEELWHHLKDRRSGEDCMSARYPELVSVDEALLQQIEELRTLVTGIRELRNQYNVPNSKPLSLYATETPLMSIEGSRALISKLSQVDNVMAATAPDGSMQILVGKEKYLLHLPIERNIEEEKTKLLKEREYLQSFVATIEKKLGNERFVSNANPEVVARERKKMEDGQAKLKAVEEALERL